MLLPQLEIYANLKAYSKKKKDIVVRWGRDLNPCGAYAPIALEATALVQA